MHLVPPLLLFLASHPLVDKYDFSSVHTINTAAAPVSGEVIKKVEERIEVQHFRQGGLVSFYGDGTFN